MSYSEIQNKAIDQLDQHANIIGMDDFEAQRDGNSPEETVVEITTFDGDEYYFRYNIWPDGETELHRFKLEKSSLIQYDERFSMFREKEKTGDVAFDVVVENEIKKEKENKKMDLEELYLDLVREYVNRHRADIEEKSQDTKRERFLAYAEDSIEDKIDWVIEAYYDNYDFCDVDVSDSDIEDVLIDEGILD